ncbi:MAG: DUF3817 domain-containing protein [Arcobacteraceae bacterium]|jgi:integral membrane protein
MEDQNTKDTLMMVGKIEGWSYLILLFVAMPMKYILGIALATKIVGMIHGGLFIWFLVALYNFHNSCKQGIKLTFIGFIASLIPFGTFYYNKELANLN